MKTVSNRRAAFSLFLSQASVAVINLPVTILLARALSAEGLGQFQFLNRIAIIAISIAHLGLPHAVAWQAQRARNARERIILIRQTTLIACVMGTLVAAVGLIVATSQATTELRLAWIVFSFYPALNLVAANLTAYFRGRLMVAQVTYIRVTQAATWLASAIALFGTDHLTVIAALASALFAQGIAVVVAAFCLARDHLRSRRQRPTAPDVASLRLASTMGFAVRVYPGLMLRDWYLFLDQVVIGIVLTTYSLGIYSVAASITVALALVASPIVNTVQPVIQRTPPERRTPVATRAIAGSLLLMTVPALTLIAAAPFLIPTIYGSDFTTSVPLTQALALASVFDAVAACCYGILLGLGRPGRSTISVSIGVLANMTLLAILLPLWGLMGAATASLIAYAVVSFVSIRAVAKELGEDYWSFIRKVLLQAWLLPREAMRLRFAPSRTQ